MAERRFIALAMPQGDNWLGVHGPLVKIVEFEGERVRREVPYSEAEARALVSALNQALRALDVGRRYNGEGPSAALGHYPFSHQSLAEIDGAPV